MLLVSGDEPETARYIGERANHYKVLPPYPWLMTHGPSMASLQKRANNSIREQLEAQGIPPPDIMVRK
jgi:hypothetical protein